MEGRLASIPDDIDAQIATGDRVRFTTDGFEFVGQKFQTGARLAVSTPTQARRVVLCAPPELPSQGFAGLLKWALAQ